MPILLCGWGIVFIWTGTDGEGFGWGKSEEDGCLDQESYFIKATE